MNARQFTFTVSSNAVPSWFAALPELEWYEAGPGINSLTGQPTYGLLARDTPIGVYAYSGGCVDTDRKTLVVMGGGHTDGSDNGVYEFRLNQNPPGWAVAKVRAKRQWPAYYRDAPNSSIAKRDAPDYQLAQLGAVYQFHQWPAWDGVNGHPNVPEASPVDWHSSVLFEYDPLTKRVWNLFQSGMLGGATGLENSMNAPTTWNWGTPNYDTVWSIDTTGFDTGTATWRCDQRTSASYLNNYTSVYAGRGPTIYNDQHPTRAPHMLRLRKADWSYAVYVETGQREEVRTDGGLTAAKFSSLVDAESGHAAVTEHGFAGFIDVKTSSMRIVDLQNYARAHVNPSVAGWPGSWGVQHGCVWHKGSQAFLIYGPSAGQNIFKVSPVGGAPATREDWFTTAWQITEVTVGGETPAPVLPGSGGSFLYGRFNLVPDLGGPGVDALIVAPDYDAPTLVLKLPAGGL